MPRTRGTSAFRATEWVRRPPSSAVLYGELWIRGAWASSKSQDGRFDERQNKTGAPKGAGVGPRVSRVLLPLSRWQSFI